MNFISRLWTDETPEPPKSKRDLTVDVEAPDISESDISESEEEPEEPEEEPQPLITNPTVKESKSINSIIMNLGDEIKDLKDEFKTQSPRSSLSVSEELDPRRKKIHKLVFAEDHEHEICPQCSQEIGDKMDHDDAWSKHKKHRLHRCLWKLKYNRIVSSFYLDTLREREERWSWMIIVISTITSGFTVANNVEDEPFTNYNTSVNIILTVSSMATSLIAAWIKKQKFVEKINEVDKYLIDINKLCEELEIQFSLLEGDRLDYPEFKKKYIPEITKFVSTNPMIPPDEWKQCVREITLKYPELVDPDNSENNKLWPWFGDLVKYTDEFGVTHNIRKPTTFMKYMKRTNKDRILSSCCRKHRECDNVYK